MEQNLTIIAKKSWHIVQVVYNMLRKGISRAKLLANLNIMLKRGKLAGKAAMHHLISNAAAASSSSTAGSHWEPQLAYPTPLNEYEFSCSNSPAYKFQLPFHLSKRRRAAHAPPQPNEGELLTAAAAALELVASQAASPALPGFGRTPVVRQLRITDSPFPVTESGEDARVDEAAEKFILKFYKDLRLQK